MSSGETFLEVGTNTHHSQTGLRMGIAAAGTITLEGSGPP